MFKLAAAFAILSAFGSVAAMPTARSANFETFVIEKANCTTMNQFESVWSIACPHWLAANGTDVSFLQGQFVPGDNNGKNPDSEAVVNCVWKINNLPNGIEEDVDVTLDIVQQMGGKSLSFGNTVFNDLAL